MPTASITGLVLYDSKLFNRTSNVGRWAASVATNFEAFATAAAPINKRPVKSHLDAGYPPGSLKGSIRVVDERIGPKHIQVVLSMGVPYAQYVIGGTHGPITATSSEAMWLPRNPGFRKRKHFTVSGQRPNNFLAEAAAATAGRHPSLRGLDHLLYQQW